MADTKNATPRTGDDRRTGDLVDGEKGVWVTLRRSIGRRGGPLYGPGRSFIPESLAESVGLSPDLAQTDGQGRPLPGTLAASAMGTRASVGESAEDRKTRESAAKDGAERQGMSARGADGLKALDEGTDRTPQPQPGQTEPTAEQQAQLDREAEIEKARTRASANAGTAGIKAGRTPKSTTSSTAASSDAKPLTKTALRKLDDAALIDLAQRNKVTIKGKRGKPATKGVLVSALYKAQVTG